jgi:diguanylate cyclase (GGDEF)-like protein
MLNLSSIFLKLLTLGCQHCSSKTLERKVIQVNLGVMVSAATILIFDLLFYFTGNWTVIYSGLIQTPFLLALPSVWWLNHTGRLFLARWAIFIIIMSDTAFTLFLAQGTAFLIHYYFLLFAIIPAAFFEISQWRSSLVLFITNLSIYCFFQINGWPSLPEIHELETQQLNLLRIIMVGSSVFTIILLLLISERYSEINETYLEKLANTDPLTSLNNRRHFIDNFQQILLKQLDQQQLALAIIDIDHFKRINDTGGHDAGDEALKHVSQLLKEHIGDDGLLARVGGEEFAMVYIDTETRPPINRASTLLLQLENAPFYYAEQKYIITVSIGLCIFTGQHNLDQIIKEADDALYSAKRRGRNRQESRKII